MKVIVDIQKLYDSFFQVSRHDFEEEMSKILRHKDQPQHWPAWAEKKTATRTAKMDGDYTQLFEDIWKLYPKKSAKGSAYTAWKVLAKKNDELFLRNNILAALEWQIESKSWKDGYIPMLENYLKGRRWEDEAPINKKERYLTPDGVWQER